MGTSTASARVSAFAAAYAPLLVSCHCDCPYRLGPGEGPLGNLCSFSSHRRHRCCLSSFFDSRSKTREAKDIPSCES